MAIWPNHRGGVLCDSCIPEERADRIVLGQRIAAHLVGMRDAKQIGRYRKEGGPNPNSTTALRLREGYKIVRMIVESFDGETAKAWLFGTNTRLDDAARWGSHRLNSAPGITASTTSNGVSGLAKAMGPEALADLTGHPVTASWRREHLLAPARPVLEGELVDLNELEVRAELEDRHAALLLEHGMEHLDLHEITSRRRIVTQTIAGGARPTLRRLQSVGPGFGAVRGPGGRPSHVPGASWRSWQAVTGTGLWSFTRI